MGCPEISGWLLVIISLLIWNKGFSQTENPELRSDSLSSPISPNYRKLHTIFAAQSAVYVGALYGLSKSWYKNPLHDFHFKDDWNNWYQLDKAGHFYTAFHISHLTSEIYRSTGINRNQRIVYGALSGFLFQTPIEILDGFSSDYGFSVTDLASNLAGSGFFAGQMLLWDELRLLPKFSAHLSPYARHRPELLGRSFTERLLKDYNGQTYWLSFSPGTFAKKGFWPSWLCFSGGYGIGGMVAAETEKSVQLGHSPYQKYLISLDIDLTKLPIRNRLLRQVAMLANTLKVPAPTLEWNSRGEFHIHPLYF